MSTHFQAVCQYGTTHSQCRCPGPNKSTLKIDCPTPEECQPVAEEWQSTLESMAPTYKPGSLEALLYAAFEAGAEHQYSAERGGEGDTDLAFGQWRRSMLPEED